MELSKFTVNCAKSAQFTNPCPELISQGSLYPLVKIIKICAIRVMTGRLPQQKLPSSEVCSLIADVFSDLAKAHSA